MESKPTFSSSSSSSSSPPAKKFDVFLSFRGEDIRFNFMAHLSRAFQKIGLLNIFKDDDALKKGKDIWPELKNSIKDSRYAVVVLSENYATSSWCLREVAKIVKCGKNNSLEIRTIFYHVNPADVRNVKATGQRKQKGSFWEAMKVHKQNPSNSEKTLEKWRNALETVANQSGYPVELNTDEAIFIDEFVTKISSELGASIRTTEGLFGMTPRLKKLNSDVLQSFANNNNVCFIAIHGMGGIGKSTLARAYYKQISHEFDGCRCFLENVREVCQKQPNGLVDLQKQLLLNILKHKFEEIGHVDGGKEMIESRLQSKKVLIVLDDVNNLDQLNGLAGEAKWFGKGSIILITTRKDDFFKGYTIYRAEYLNPTEALQLFSWKAFGSNEPLEEYKELSKLVVEYASNLPLALTVLGSLLRSKKTREWESALHILKNWPQKEIFENLKISFDDLNENDQHIFLDIACFFKGWDQNRVAQILDSCDFGSEYGINNLINKSLLSIKYEKDTSRIWMHDLLEVMGKEIVRKGYGNVLRRQSRIWDKLDLYHILDNKEGTNEIEAIVTSVDGTVKYRWEALSSMKKLRLLMIFGTGNYVPGDCDDGPELCSNLKYIFWQGFPYNVFSSRISQYPYKPLYNLKVIDLSSSLSVTKFEDFTMVQNLETLNLRNCRNMSEIHLSIKYLKKLILLDLSLCTSLEKLPEEITYLTSLQTLTLCWCKLEKLPENMEQLKRLRYLGIAFTRIEQLPSSIFLMENLEHLYCNSVTMITSAIRDHIIRYRTTGKCFFPAKFSTMNSDFLTKLDLSDCNLTGPEAFPEGFSKLVSLEYLNLRKNPFSVLPPVINGLSRLRYLLLDHCKSLISLETELLPSSLNGISVNYCSSLASFLDPLPCSAFCVDCTELVKRQDGKMTALASLARFLEDPSRRRDRLFQFVVPQSDYELPSWFINQSSTASISIKVDPSRNSKLIGFATVFCFPANSYTDVFSCDIRVGCGEKREFTGKLGKIESRMLDHLFLHYNSCDHLSALQLDSRSYHTLEFSFLAADGEHCSSCGPCGVRLVYEEDIEELKGIISKYNNHQSPDQKDVQSSYSQSISQLSKLKTGLRVILDLEDNGLELVEKQQYADEDPPINPESNPSMVGNTHFGVFRNYSAITTKFLERNTTIRTQNPETDFQRYFQLQQLRIAKRFKHCSLNGDLSEALVEFLSSKDWAAFKAAAEAPRKKELKEMMSY